MLRNPQEKHEISDRLSDDLDGLEDGELEGFAFLTKLGEQYGCDRIHGKDSTHALDAGLISVITEG